MTFWSQTPRRHPDGADGNPVLIEPRIRNIVGAIIRLKDIPDAYLYTLRELD